MYECHMQTTLMNLFTVLFLFNLWRKSYSFQILDDNILLNAQFSEKVLNCLDIGGESSSLIAAGGSDPIVRIWDPRKPGLFVNKRSLSYLQTHTDIHEFALHAYEAHAFSCCGYHLVGTSAPVFQFSSHTSWVSACKWHKKSWFHLVSASYDGKVMLWDLRTAVIFFFLVFFFIWCFTSHMIRASLQALSLKENPVTELWCFSMAVAFSCYWFTWRQGIYIHVYM